MDQDLLQVDHVTRRFGGVVAISDASFVVRAGELVGVIGPNGAGKTTLFNMISGVDQPDAGRIVFAGQDVARLKASNRLHLGMSRTFQSVSILYRNSTVRTNVMRACQARAVAQAKGGTLGFLFLGGRQMEQQALDLLARVGLEAQADRLAAELPYGHQRLLGVAMALASDPRLLMLDEPAAGLLPHETDALVRLIRQVRDRGVAVLIVEHDVKTIMDLCDRIVVMNFGAVIADGTPAEVRASPAVIAAYLGSERSGANAQAK